MPERRRPELTAARLAGRVDHAPGLVDRKDSLTRLGRGTERDHRTRSPDVCCCAVGFFGQFVFSGGRWGDGVREEIYLSLDIHDSDIVTVQYRPASPPAMGVCYLGYEPREYFDDPSASAPVDRAAEAQGLATWAKTAWNKDVDREAIRCLLAEPGNEPDDAFAEDTARRLLRLLNIPPPAELTAPE